MIVTHKNQSYKLSIAAWEMAADSLNCELEDLANKDSTEVFWSVVIGAARYYNSLNGKGLSAWKARRLRKKLIREHMKKELKGKELKSGIDKLTNAIDEVSQTAQEKAEKKRQESG